VVDLDAASVESEDSTERSSGDDTSSTDGALDHPRPTTSTTFIEIIHHPHSGILEPEFIFCDLPSASPATDLPLLTQHQLLEKPWAPFRTRADFEFAETMVQSAAHKDTIKKLIKGIRYRWTDPGHSHITFRNLKDYTQSLNVARTFVVPVSVRYENTHCTTN
jgi:hypothetical protein